MLATSQLLLKITTKSHSSILILNLVGDKYNKFVSNSALMLGPERKACLDNVVVKYHLVNTTIGLQMHAASECRINMSLRFRAIIRPTFNIHDLVHRHQDPIEAELSALVLAKMNEAEKKIEPRFDDLDYTHECPIEYQDIGQIMLAETIVRATFQVYFDVPPACQFGNSKTQTFLETQQVVIPLNGSFICQYGRSSTCNRRTSISSSPRYRLIEH